MNEITEQQRTELVQRALQARKRAYAPYSQYRVGAALLTESGQIFEGVNIENAAYPAGICAERSAVFAAVSSGQRAFRAIAVATKNGGTPCGSCRQVLAEFGLDTRIFLSDAEGQILDETTVKDLLPNAFGPEGLRSA
ncbi:MAG TPA: cytidine deaminase [Anaerolineales bacterium]|nr:cytidine deaminase [Anaerolineales bacterium]